jgi:hypothetical protein
MIFLLFKSETVPCYPSPSGRHSSPPPPSGAAPGPGGAKMRRRVGGGVQGRQGDRRNAAAGRSEGKPRGGRQGQVGPGRVAKSLHRHPPPPPLTSKGNLYYRARPNVWRDGAVLPPPPPRCPRVEGFNLTN